MKRSILKMVYGILVSMSIFFLSGCQEENAPEFEIIPGQVTDVDGNIYKTVEIGYQEWMSENLKTTKYRDGSSIEYPAGDLASWQINTEGAYAWYQNDISNKDLYGALYNWYAVSNPNGLCPVGWRVPTPEDYKILIHFLAIEYKLSNNNDDVNALGNKLKSCRMLNSPFGGECNVNTHPRWNFHLTSVGTDEFAFSALPAGNRVSDGRYSGMGAYGFFWTLSEYSSDMSTRYYLNYDRNRLYSSNINKREGYSVRCIKE